MKVWLTQLVPVPVDLLIFYQRRRQRLWNQKFHQASAKRHTLKPHKFLIRTHQPIVTHFGKHHLSIKDVLGNIGHKETHDDCQVLQHTAVYVLIHFGTYTPLIGRKMQAGSKHCWLLYISVMY